MLHTNALARAIVLPILRTVRFDVTICHHWVPRARIRLNVYRHKGYWFHGRNRERASILLMRRLIADGDCVFDVGAHIGYFSVIYADCVGPRGRVFAFEPGVNNLPYTRSNLRPWPQVRLVEKAAARRSGTATLFMEDLTGQNNSLLNHYDVYEGNARSAFTTSRTVPVEVETTSLDEFASANRPPDFVKIDVEGAEYDVLCGMQALLREARPLMLIEVSHDHQRTVGLLHDARYRLIDAAGAPLDAGRVNGLMNLFAVPGERWADVSRRLA